MAETKKKLLNGEGLLTLLKGVMSKVADKVAGEETARKTADDTLKSELSDKVAAEETARKTADDTMKTELLEKIASAGGLKREIVDELPGTESADKNTIYMVPKSKTGTNNKYDEYMFIDDAFEKIGDTEVDLSGYLQTSDVNVIAPLKVATEAKASLENNAIAIGRNAKALFQNGIAIGYSANATTKYSIVIGSNTSSNGMYSVAIGVSASAPRAYSVAIGYASTVDANYVVSVGNAGTTRRIIFVGDPTSAQDAATKNYVDNEIVSARSSIGGDIDNVILSLPYVYEATLAADSWGNVTDDDGTPVPIPEDPDYIYQQKVSVTSESGAAPAVTADSIFLTPCYFTPTGVYDTDKALAEALAIINDGYTVSGDGIVIVRVAEKPTCDITVKWTIRA